MVSLGAALLLGVTLCCAAALTPASAPLELEPMAAFVLRPEPGRALIVVRGQLDEAPRVEYWVTCDGCTQPPERSAGVVVAQPCADHWVADLSNLPVSGARVAYRVRSSAGDTELASFKPGARAPERFRFAALGNTWGDIEVHHQIVQAIRAEHVDFVVHTGNAVESAERDDQWSEFFRIEQPLLAAVPIFPALGKSDVARQDPFVSVLWTDTLAWYHQDWGNLRIVAVDDGVACAGGCFESGFVRAALAEGARRGMLLMLMLTSSPHSSADGEAFPELRSTITGLAREHGVEVVLAGGAPQYERTRPIDGTTYIVTGSAGAPSFPVRHSAFSEVVRVEPSYVVFDVASDRLSVRVVGVSGNVIDSTVIQAVPPVARVEGNEGRAPVDPDLTDRSPRAGEGPRRWR